MYKRPGYEPSETSSVRHDALGQRVRDRFNEDLTQEDINRTGSKNLKLNQKILTAADTKS